MTLLLLLLLLAVNAANAVVYDAKVAFGTLVAGAESDASVEFSSSADVVVGSALVVDFPAGFRVSSSAALTVTSANGAATLSLTSTSILQVVATVDTDAIAADAAFAFAISSVANPAAGTTGIFSITVQDSSGNQLDTIALEGVSIASSELSAASVAPVDAGAGTTGTATVAFTSDVELPISSVIVITFPNDFTVESTASLSNPSSSVDISTAVSAVVGTSVKIEVVGSAVAAGSSVTFQIDGITNPGATTTGVFAIVTTDSAGYEFQFARSIAGAVIASSLLGSAAIAPLSSLAGVSTTYDLSVQLAVPVPVGGYFVVIFPNDFSNQETPTLVDSSATDELTGSVQGTKFSFQATFALSAGHHEFYIDPVQNPGVSTTGNFSISTTDANGFVIESGGCAGVEITAGSLASASFTPVLAHPGIASRVDVSFTTSAKLSPDDFVHITLPAGEYSAATLSLSVSMLSHTSVTATAVWDTQSTSILVLFTGSSSVPAGSIVTMEITALQMPPSVRTQLSSGVIQSWNAKGLRLDGPDTLIMSAITAVQDLPCSWVTAIPMPGIRSDVLVTFSVSGEIPAGGTIALALPTLDFTAQSAGDLPDVNFVNLASVSGSAVWVDNDAVLLITTTAPIPAYSSSIEILISQLDTPVSVRSAGRTTATLTTFDSSGIEIDGPSSLNLDVIRAGVILGSRIWVSVNAFAGITSDQRVSFSTNGRIGIGGSLNFELPDQGWTLAAAGTASFESPSLGSVGVTSWDSNDRILSVVLAAELPAASLVTLVIPGVKNPPKEIGDNYVYLTSRAPDGGVIDGPGVISSLSISRGTLEGNKTWVSVTTQEASMISDQRLRVILSGELPSGSHIQVALPSVGWRFSNLVVPFAEFTLPSSVSVNSVTWDAVTSTLVIVTLGNLDEGAEIELVVKNMTNPYSLQPAATCTVSTFLSDGGVVDESLDIVVNEVLASTLSSVGSWIPAIATPGVVSTQTIQLRTGGQLNAGATLCITLQDDWEVLFGASATLTTSTIEAASTISWISPVLCLQSSISIDQGSDIQIQITHVRTPSSVKPAHLLQITIYSHTGGVVNEGSIEVAAISAGTLTGPLTWQSLLKSPGPVAGLVTSAQLSLQTAGRVPSGGYIQLTLPDVWTLPALCTVAFSKPALLSTASCSYHQFNLTIMDDISENTEIEIVVEGIRNPETLLTTETATCKTIAPTDGGVIDISATITTSAITCILEDVTSSTGDQFVAVVGVVKRFTFVGVSVSANDVVKFVDASTTSDANCGPSTIGHSDAGGIDIAKISSNFDVDIQFLEPSPIGQPFALCYKFGENAFKLYSIFSFTVKSIESFTSIEGDPDVAVASQEKTWVFNGFGLSPGDQIRWIDAAIVDDPASVLSPPDCLDTSMLAELELSASSSDTYSRAVVIDGSAARISVSFAESNHGKSFCLCYKFGNEPFVVYSKMRVQVRYLLSIEAAGALGSDNVAVVDAFKTFNLVGDGMLLNDRVYFIKAGSALSCEASSTDSSLRLEHTVNSQPQTMLFVDSNMALAANFSNSAAGTLAMLCYQFGNEPFHLYATILVEVKMITAYSGDLGEASLAVADVPEPLTFLGYGVSPGDAVRWTHRSEEFCDTNLATLTSGTTFELVDTVVLDSTNSGEFNFTADQSDYSPILCYRFGGEPFQRYAAISINIATLRSKAAIVGAKDVAVAAASKKFVLSGIHTDINDRVGWTSEVFSSDPCANLSLLIAPETSPPTGTDYLSFTSPYSSWISAEFSVAFSPIHSGERVYLCYGFGSEPLKLYEGLYLDVKSIRNMRALLGSQSVAVSGERKTFLFDGDGVASGDFAKFVANVDCSDTGVALLNIMKEFDDSADMAMYLYDNGAGTTFGNFQFSASRDSAGLSRSLCYRFASEPYKLYEDLSVDIKTVWGITKYMSGVDPNTAITYGSDSTAVVNERKLMAFSGVGVSPKDELKFVDGSLYAGGESSLDCGSQPPQGLIGRDLAIYDNLTTWFLFDYGSNSTAWLLCYKFSGESFRLYPSIRLTVKALTSVRDLYFPQDTTLGSVAIIGHEKRWLAIGSGVSNGDQAKFVAQNVLTSADCGEGNTSIADGSAVMTVARYVSSEATLFYFTGTISSYPVTTDEVFHLCYQFGDEPYSLIAGYSLAMYGITHVDRDVALVGAPMNFQVSGLRLSNMDQLSWTTSTASCSSMVVDPTTVSDLYISTLVFSKSYSKLFLCYSFSRQPFDIFSSIALEVVIAEVWIPQAVAIVADQETQIDLSGTFGITDTEDQVAWIPSDSLSCSSDIIAAYSSVMVTSIQSVTKASSGASPRSGAASLALRYTAPTSTGPSPSRSSFATWKLCYRFGSMNSYLLFGNVLVNVMNLDQVQIRQRSVSSSGSVLSFQFEGQGLQDFDVAKWVSALDATSDADCVALSAIAGSVETNVINQRATFIFTEQSSGSMGLCYKFQGQSYKLYSDIKVIDASGSSTSTTSTVAATSGNSANNIVASIAEEQAAVSSEQIVPSREVATVALKLDKDISDIPPGSAAESNFKMDFTQTLALALGIDTTRITITALTAGSVIVQFLITPSPSAGDLLVSEIVDDLAVQVLDPNSALRTSSTGFVLKDPGSALSVSISTLAPSTSDASVNLRALGYQRNGLFSFVKSVYSVTEKSGSLSIPIIRQQGIGGESSITLMVRLRSDGTATYDQDYRFASSTVISNSVNGVPELLFVRFDPGDTVQTVEVEILDDNDKEAQFEVFTLELVSPETPGIALGDTNSVTIRLFDYDEGRQLGTWQFRADSDQLALGWAAVENGETSITGARNNGQLRIDANGIFVVDAVVGEREYNQSCDLAAPTGECGFACEMGADLESMKIYEAAYSTLQLNGDDYVASAGGIDVFPSTELTISLWVKTIQTDPNACLLSYASTTNTSWAAPLALCNPSNLELSINAGSRMRALSTFVNVSDGAWHFLAVTWSADDGRVALYDNGMLAFSGGPYRVSSSIAPSGMLVLGQLVLSTSTSNPPCAATASAELVAPSDIASLTSVICQIANGASGFVGDVQHVHVWARRLSRSELLQELTWPPAAASSNALILGWNFDSANVDLNTHTVADFALKGQGERYPGLIHCSDRNTSNTSSCLATGVAPSVHTAFPCGPVYSNVWHFSAPITLVSKLSLAYGGRLQFRMLAPSSNGAPRPRRGRLSIFSDSGATQMSLSLGSFALPGKQQWTYYSAVLREDFAWIDEPSGIAMERGEFRRRLAAASALWIRGDLWGHSAVAGGALGQEVVYLNDVALFAR